MGGSIGVRGGAVKRACGPCGGARGGNGGSATGRPGCRKTVRRSGGWPPWESMTGSLFCSCLAESSSPSLPALALQTSCCNCSGCCGCCGCC